jgi:hypothetical protein
MAVAWDWPTTYEDDSPVVAGDLTGVQLQVGTCADVVIPTFGVVSRGQLVTFPATTYTFVGLANGQYCVRGYARHADATRNALSSNVIAVKITGGRVRPVVIRLVP